MGERDTYATSLLDQFEIISLPTPTSWRLSVRVLFLISNIRLQFCVEKMLKKLVVVVY